MVVVTGALGFIGSCLISYLNQKGIEDIVAVDDFSKKEKDINLAHVRIHTRVERDVFLDWFDQNHPSVSIVFHLGARTDTTEFDRSIFLKLNLDYSRYLFLLCQKYSKPIIYASSAATYGAGELGYSDNDDALTLKLKPLNPYGDSKQDFDKWLLQMVESREILNTKSFLGGDLAEFPFWVGLKFFNVYGPNEYHKGRMASTIFHFFNQISEKGSVNLFQSHRSDFKDGEQMRDFIYVKDVVKVLFWFYEKSKEPIPSVKSGIYNLGTGKARSFNDLVTQVFKNTNKSWSVNYIPTPEDIRDTYQYFTEADMKKLQSAGYTEGFTSLEEGIADYVQNYLAPKKYF
ncbi:MAG: ADP-glyceromanno-heptose 6-epimerase [Saprospiraceae bacterium]|nr:ADP-glyceromanno-heptose 6-epimerase [Saprospiraceae bacterium]